MQFDSNYLSAQRAYDNMLPEELIPVTCPKCDGFGHVPDDEKGQVECPACDGSGEVEVPVNKGKRRRNEDF